MADPGPLIAAFLDELSERLTGTSLGRRRLLTELRDHLHDATAANLARGLSAEDAVVSALEALGPPAELAGAWESRLRRRRKQQRLRVGLLIGTAASATILAAAQYAEGRRPLTVTPGCRARATLAAAARCPLPGAAPAEGH